MAALVRLFRDFFDGFFSGKNPNFFFEVELGHQSVPHMGLSVRSVSQRGERGGESPVGEKKCSCSTMMADARYEMTFGIYFCFAGQIVCLQPTVISTFEKKKMTSEGCVYVLNGKICSKQATSISLHVSQLCLRGA